MGIDMGKGWKSAGISANAQKKGAKFTKLAREIQVAAKLGGPDPEANSRLQLAINVAREHSCPKDTIERAIKKGAGLLDDGNIIEEAVYEGFSPHKVGILVECQSDNKHRTAADIRSLFKTHDGLMGEPGSVGWMFDRVCLVEGSFAGKLEDPEVEAIEAGANEVTDIGDGVYSFIGAPEDLKNIQEALTKRGWKIKTAELSYKAKTLTELNEEQKKDVLEFIHALDENDDTHRIHASIEF
jgi:YebC/PmpR family DNA-binding regulatory protein